MKKHRFFKLVFLILVSSVLLLCTDAEDVGLFDAVSCDECYSPEPDSADLIVNLTIDAENQKVPLIVYKGKLEEGKIIFNDTVSETPVYIYAKINEYYSAKANYSVGAKKIVAFDGSKMINRIQSDLCDNQCWTIHGGKFDLELKK